MKQSTVKAPNAPPVATLEAGLEAARVACEAALDKFSARNVNYNEALSQGDRAAVVKANTELTEATIDRDMAVATVTRLERELSEARGGVEHSRRSALYAEAKAARDAAAGRLEAEYTKAVAAILALLEACEDADRMVARANRDLPEGASPLEVSEVVARYTPGRPREILSEEIVDRWAFEATKLPCDINLPGYPLAVNPDGKTGILRGPGNSVPVVLLPFKKITATVAKRGVLPPSFFYELRLPALTGDYLLYPNNAQRLAAYGREEIVAALVDEEEPKVEVTFELLQQISP